jgi:MoxR-like ATPase
MRSAERSAVDDAVKAAQPLFIAAKDELAKVIVGQEEMLGGLLLALLSDGHVLLEGLPGLAKTLAITTLAKIIDCPFKRIQFTPDLLPADLIGTAVYSPKEEAFTTRKGPIFTSILLADEINRAPAKVQSALLEVMQERQITISGETFAVDKPFMVLATQNPIEQEGTYNLPEAQVDRFMFKIKIGYPSKEEEKQILLRMATLDGKPVAKPVLSATQILEARKVVNSIYVDDMLLNYIVDIVDATRHPQAYGVKIEGLLLYGASPRASIFLKLAAQAKAFLAGRSFALPQDVKDVGHDILRHRLERTYEAEAEEISVESIIGAIFDKIPVL